MHAPFFHFLSSFSLYPCFPLFVFNSLIFPSTPLAPYSTTPWVTPSSGGHSVLLNAVKKKCNWPLLRKGCHRLQLCFTSNKQGRGDDPGNKGARWRQLLLDCRGWECAQISECMQSLVREKWRHEWERERLMLTAFKKHVNSVPLHPICTAIGLHRFPA